MYVLILRRYRSLELRLDFDISSPWIPQPVLNRNKASKPVRWRIREQILQLDSGVDRDQVAPFQRLGSIGDWSYVQVQRFSASHSHGSTSVVFCVYKTALYYYNKSSARSTEKAEITTHVSARFPDVVMQMYASFCWPRRINVYVNVYISKINIFI